MRPPFSSASASAIGLCAGLLAYGAVLMAFVGAVPGGSDTSGYFNEARLFSRLEIHAPRRVLPGLRPDQAPPYLYVPLGFRPSADGTDRIVPTYPPGLPLLLASAARVAGWRHAGDLLLILHSLAGVALIFALGRMCGLPPAWSLIGAGVLMASPLYLHMSLWALSDVPATAWAAAAVVAAMRSRERTGWALVSGLCVAMGFLLRPSNFLILAPVVIAAGPSPGALILIALGSAPGAAAWMAVNHAAYGAYLQSGYGAIGAEFRAGLVRGTLVYYARWLPLLLSPIVAVSPAVLAFARRTPRTTAVLVAWAAVYAAFYAPYRWTHQDWWFLRFLLPAAPALIVAGLLVVRDCLERLRKSLPGAPVGAAAAVLLVAAVGVEAAQIVRFNAWAIGRGERKYGRVADWLNANVPRNSAVVANELSGALYYHTGFTIVRADQLDRATGDRVHAAARSGAIPLYAALFPYERGALAATPGPWTLAGSVDDITIWRCDWAKP